MEIRDLGPKGEQALDQVLGYLNFSSGAEEPRFLSALNQLYSIVSEQEAERCSWRMIGQMLRARLQLLSASEAAFKDISQAEAILDLLLEHFLLAYLEFHRDLLFHQNERAIYTSFFVGRVCEAILRQGAPWNETERIIDQSILQLNDYLGHRPVAALESQKIEPYAHEWVRPVPLYIRDSGVSAGPYHDVIERALALLNQSDEDLLLAAHFDPNLLDELAFDPRAYDFDHPVNKRPNYQFGQWDPHHIDNQGRYRRFVIQQVTLDALMARLNLNEEIPSEELLQEAAAVLAGTILMASGVSGGGPATHDSSVTLATLLPRIAYCRDEFYERLLLKSDGQHGDRLKEEAVERRQPFGGARQHLNSALAARRAAQLEHVYLAKIFARMGFPEAAMRQANVVPVASARMLCRIDCQLTTGLQLIKKGDLAKAAGKPPEIMDLLQRAIECGAVIDPWNILGFDAHFSLMPAMENSVRDHRADELIEWMERIFEYYFRLWSEAAAIDNQEICQQISLQFGDTANWWRNFAIHEISSVEGNDPLDALRAAEHVARALNLWHKGGASSGDLAFWAPHAEMFDSPKAYALVIHALLERGDFVSSSALIAHWLGQADSISLEQGESSFHKLAMRWLVDFHNKNRAAHDDSTAENDHPEACSVVCKFFDYLEANAEHYWNAPKLQLGDANGNSRASGQLADEEEDKDSLFSAAYEDVVYRDSTDDGVEGEIFESGIEDQDDLSEESKRIVPRMAFLNTMARLWKCAAVFIGLSCLKNAANRTEKETEARLAAALERWIAQAKKNQNGLQRLIAQVRDYRLPISAGDHDSMVEYDRRRLLKESLLERAIVASVETADAERMLRAALLASTSRDEFLGEEEELDQEELQAALALSDILQGDIEQLRDRCKKLIEVFQQKMLLYVPLSKGGDPCEISAVRGRQRMIKELLVCLPRLGLLEETCALIETAREMEHNQPAGLGAVTEFDELFSIGYRSLVEHVVDSAQGLLDDTGGSKPNAASLRTSLVSCLERLTESLLLSWLAHSRTLRLSVMEKAADKQTWKKLVAFIEKYGEDIFTQQFLNLGNVRAILHQGVEAWLEKLEEDPREEIQMRLLDDLDSELPRKEAIAHLSLILESLIENFSEYRDYNSTTTQSDRGELLYMLLDFLRLRASYDRICWNLKPVVLAHEIMVRREEEQAAKMWRRALNERVGREADRYLKRLADLQKKYAMRMPTVANRLQERFLRPMHIDRLCALVEPAMKEALNDSRQPTFELLEHETDVLTRRPSGVGLDPPAWLLALDEEVDRASRSVHEKEDDLQTLAAIAPKLQTFEEIQEQIERWSNRNETDAAEEPIDEKE